MAIKKKKTSDKKVSKTTPKKSPIRDSNSLKVDGLISDMNEKYGEGAVRIGLPFRELPRVPTGLISLDLDLGGGVPVGRATNIAGGFSVAKSTIALHILKAFQKHDFPCAFFDVEGTSGTGAYLSGIGVDTNNLLYSNPSSLEETCNLILDIQRDGRFKFALWDCIIVTKPNKVVDKAVGDSVQMGVMQTQLDEFFAKFSMNNNKLSREGKTPFTLLCVNQLREKPTQYGNPEYCLHYDTKINFVDGRSIPIGEVVEKRIEGQVWSFNEKKQTFEPKEILDWKYNGDIVDDTDYYYVESNGIDSPKGKFGVTVTYNHKLLTDKGWKDAQDLCVSDKLITKYPSIVNGTVEDFLWGSLVGDSHLCKCHKNIASLRFRDSKNPEYVEWKLKKLEKHLPFKCWENGIFSSSPSVELKLLKDEVGERNPLVMLKDHFSLMGLAIWYMDDGNFDRTESNRYRCSISVKRFAQDKKLLNQIVEALTALGFPCSPYSQGSIVFDYDAAHKLFQRICMFVPECMQYKLPKEFKDLYTDFELMNELLYKSTTSDILSIRLASKRQLRKRGKYDISVGDNQNFLAGGSTNGVVVHNTPGGRAKDFAFSIDLRLRRAEWITEGKGTNKSVVGQVVSYRTEKNKTYKRMQEGQLDLYIEENSLGVPPFNFDNFKSLVAEAVSFGVIEQGGAWFYLDPDKNLKFNGFDKLVGFLRENPKEVARLEKELLKLVSTSE